MDNKENDIMDHGGRRLGIDRRQLDLPHAGRDRRDSAERRSGEDRRDEWSYNDESDERREAFHIKPRRK